MSDSIDMQRLFGVYIRGVAMGAADVVPGVSGGTVAFITGIYEELLNSIKSINPSALLVLLKQGPLAFWSRINGNFLIALMLGILSSVASLARVISYLLDQHPLLLWSFFFGLIAASSIHMIKQVKVWQPSLFIAIILGALAAYGVSEINPSELSPGLLMYFGVGCVAICAMILPGVSGSFILVILGMYSHVLTAVRNLDLLVLMSFAAGCGVGLLSFSHLLSWLFKRFHDLTLSLLTGFLIGSLNLVWPWKQVLSYYQNSAGEQLALEQKNILPSLYQSQVGVDSHTVFCIALMILGLVLVYLLEKSGRKS
jgi:putative membrane protein